MQPLFIRIPEDLEHVLRLECKGLRIGFARYCEEVVLLHLKSIALLADVQRPILKADDEKEIGK